MALSKFAKAAKSKNQQIKNQVHAHLLYGQYRNHPQRIGSSRANTKSIFCREILERLRKRVARVRPDIKDKWMLHYDDGSCHTVLSIAEFLPKKSILVVSQPPYSPDLCSSGFFLFPRLKKCLKDRHFGTLNNIQKTATDLLKSIPASKFQRCCEE